MSQFLVYVPVEPFIKQYLINHYGEPVQFDSQSVENAILRLFTKKKPSDYIFDGQKSNEIAICIPDNSYKDPLVYNYLGPKGKKALRECIDDVFKRNMFNELYKIIDGSEKEHGCTVMGAIDAWCEYHGIDIDYDYTIRQRFYRLRDSYKKNGINLKQQGRNRDKNI